MQKVEQPYFVVASRIQQFSKGADFRWLDARFFSPGLERILRLTVALQPRTYVSYAVIPWQIT